MIIVTGASRGLGKAICERLSASGNEVLGLARSEVQAPYATRTCDVTRFDDLRALAGELRQKGAVEALINVAGVASMNLAITTPETTVRQIVETNLLGTIFACQAFAPLMLRHKMGRIVNFSTIAVALGLKGESIYAASKAGIEGFSRAFAREMADFGITVNCIAPGPIDTDLLRGVSQEQIARIIEHQIFPKQFAPSAVCDLVETLLSPKAQMLTGQVLHVGGV
jgi:3-oxoacyl-[acyl-carrier protein] reductase